MTLNLVNKYRYPGRGFLFAPVAVLPQGRRERKRQKTRKEKWRVRERVKRK